MGGGVTINPIRSAVLISAKLIFCDILDKHSWLLGSDVDILPNLLLPLCDNHQYTDEEYDEMPPDLQYLPDDKTRETDPAIRKMLLEALIQVHTPNTMWG